MDINIIVIVGIILVVIVVIGILASSSGGSKQAEWKIKTKSQINKIQAELNTNNTIIAKNCLIESDKLLDYVLKSRRARGETMGERLKSSANLFNKQDYNNVWNAHKLRNQLVHELDSSISTNVLKGQTINMLNATKKLIN